MHYMTVLQLLDRHTDKQTHTRPQKKPWLGISPPSHKHVSGLYQRNDSLRQLQRNNNNDKLMFVALKLYVSAPDW